MSLHKCRMAAEKSKLREGPRRGLEPRERIEPDCRRESDRDFAKNAKAQALGLTCEAGNATNRIAKTNSFRRLRQQRRMAGMLPPRRPETIGRRQEWR